MEWQQTKVLLERAPERMSFKEGERANTAKEMGREDGMEPVSFFFFFFKML